MTKKRVVKIIAAFLLGFILAGGLSNKADAVVGFTNVGNESSRTIKIACSYGGTLIELKPGQNSMMPGKCTKSRSDTDQFLTPTTQILIFSGPVKKDGCYRVQPNVRNKIPDLSVGTLYDLKRGCSGKKYRGYWNYR